MSSANDRGQNDKIGAPAKERALNRHNILLGGTGLAAVSTLLAATPNDAAQAQAQRSDA
jgi:hypothetical protein